VDSRDGKIMEDTVGGYKAIAEYFGGPPFRRRRLRRPSRRGLCPEAAGPRLLLGGQRRLPDHLVTWYMGLITPNNRALDARVMLNHPNEMEAGGPARGTGGISATRPTTRDRVFRVYENEIKQSPTTARNLRKRLVMLVRWAHLIKTKGADLENHPSWPPA